jgi:ubiquinone biosynthesis protein
MASHRDDPRRARRGSTVGRAFEIVFKVCAFLAWLAARKARIVHAPSPARRFAQLLEGLGTSFVKLGQQLSLRSDLFPPDYLVELQKLQDRVRPFAAAEAIAEIEYAFGKPIAELFVRFDVDPLAAASVAQVHSARTFEGEEVVVKVLRPGVGWQVDRDMRMLLIVVRMLSHFSPLLARYRAEAVVREIRANLRRELDLREEARSALRFAEAFGESATLSVPKPLAGLCTETVMVQERTSGKRIDELPRGAARADLAQNLIGAYMRMLFVLGFFHGDPHPGNVIVRDDGRLALLDFGVVGSLDRPTRHALAAFMLAFTEQDTDWVLDSWLELGMLARGVDREALRPAVAALMAEYSRRPLEEWSVGEAFLRLLNATRGQHFGVPLHLLVLARTIILLEAMVRMLDPGFSLLDSLSSRAREVMQSALEADAGGTRRLQYETAIAAHEWQRLLAASMRKLREGGVKISLDHAGVVELSDQLMRGASRVSLALVTLGLYLAASLLLQYRSGPELYGVPVLPAFFYVCAGWFTYRLVRRIGRNL